jgi:hypothetical protein
MEGEKLKLVIIEIRGWVDKIVVKSLTQTRRMLNPTYNQTAAIGRELSQDVPWMHPPAVQGG